MQKFALPASKGEANHEVDKIDKSSQFICSQERHNTYISNIDLLGRIN